MNLLTIIHRSEGVNVHGRIVQRTAISVLKAPRAFQQGKYHN